jgi:NAD-dependent dihydropyrimidine dehydrogenase PreA subunit
VSARGVGIGEALREVADHLLPTGSALPGATEAMVAPRMDDRVATWDAAVTARVRSLVLAWEWSPVLSRHRRRFSKLTRDQQGEWIASCYRSRIAFRRLHITALKQLIFLEWGSSPRVEDALGYDYRCRRDEEPHGTLRHIEGEVTPAPVGPEPADYYRPGPAMSSNAIPKHLTLKRTFVPPASIDLEVPTWPELSDGHRETVDVVVVGSGAGGSVVAATLAEAGRKVLVLEEGPYVTAADFAGPMFDRFQRFCRDNGMTQAWGKPPIPLPLGRVVGGTTVVNSGTCFRAPDRVLARWAGDFGVTGANADEMAPHYEACEEFLNVRPVPWELLGPNGMAAHKGAVALGLSGGPLLRNITDCHGCGQCAFGCPTNAKQAMHISYLPRAQRAGARVYAGCRVERIISENGRAIGVEASLVSGGRKKGTLRVDARHVVVCAGAVHTPALLHRSGVPDRSNQTGRNLRIHPATGVGGFFDSDVVNWKGTLQSYYIDEFFDSHELMFEATTTVPSIGAGSIPGIGAQAMSELADFRRLATLGFYVSDTSKGRVYTLRNGEAVATYRLNQLDAYRMSVGIAVAAEVMLEAGASRVYPGLPGIDSISAREDLAQLRERRIRPEHLRLTAFHPMGTARMGNDPARSVVDPFGHHHDVSNLWVADASTFPSCVGVNPQMTIMAFAKRTAERITALT